MMKSFFSHLLLSLLTLSLIVACQGDVSDVPPKQDCHQVQHVMGETCIPNAPQGVVVLHDYLVLDAVIALGITPIGAVGNHQGEHPFPPWLKEETETVARVGTAREPNLETVLKLQPDLIISLEGEGHAQIYEQLSQIAPTLIIPSERAIFPELKFLGKALKREEKAQTLIAKYEQRLEELRTAMGRRLTTTEVSLVRFLPSGVRIEGNSYNVGKILKDAGFPRPPAQQISRPIMVSLEQIEKIDGDVMFANTIANPNLEADANETLKRYKNHPLWKQLRAVQNDQVYEVDPYLWSGNGVLWSFEIIDDLFRYLLE